MSHYPHPEPDDPHQDPRPASDTPFTHPPSGGYPNAKMAPYSGLEAQTGGWQAPPGYQPASAGGQPLTTIGDIAVYQHEVVTPAGRFPIKGSAWTVTDMSHVHESIPAYAVVLAVLLFVFCLLGLLFLLIKERRIQGYVQVAVHGNGVFHSTMIPVHSPQTLPYVMQQVNYARTLSAAA
ncbi:hypothetical protein [Allosalinactinospora lopnorensis]|uniref:hypothetical protein n=1 Tax=Allosalinactinospora lopnorensis TaxID=1352348 RepID=UPI000623BBE5|nr:hypothetical protein [Allosalinactinospora lopnorensis]